MKKIAVFARMRCNIVNQQACFVYLMCLLLSVMCEFETTLGGYISHSVVVAFDVNCFR